MSELRSVQAPHRKSPRQVVYSVKEKGVELHPPFLFLSAAIDFIKANVKGRGLAGQAYFVGRDHSEALNGDDHCLEELRLYGDANFVITIDEVDA